MKKNILLIAGFFVSWGLLAQAQEPKSGYTVWPLADLSAFKPTGKANWQIAGNVSADLSQNEVLTGQTGTGVLLNLPDKDNRANLLSAQEFGDVEVEFEFMMATHSNSGFYLMGRYEVQLLDSWGVKNPRYGDCGGIYRRRRLPDGYEYEGHAPRFNACKAPGLWQKMFISFQAPRFDATGKKIQNGKFLKVILNGATIQENVEVTGPTGGPISEQESATGPFMIQGDHGAVAFRNFSVKSFSQPAPTLNGLRYTYYQAAVNRAADLAGKKAVATATTSDLNWAVASETNNFGLIYTGNLNVTEAGKYTLTVQAGGSTHFKINGQEVLKDGWTLGTDEGRSVSVDLQKGDNLFELGYFKTDGWLQPLLGLYVAGEKLRKTPLHVPSSAVLGTPVTRILTDAKDITMLRSFMDFRLSSKSKRIVHAISVGYPEGLHYTLDLDNGALAQVWRGGFLDTTPMWNDRGDGSSRPLGSLTLLNDWPLAEQATGSALPDSLRPAANYRFLGYNVNAKGEPTFRYTLYDSTVEDDIRLDETAKYFVREVRTAAAVPSLKLRLADADKIEAMPDGSYAVNDKAYFVKVLEGGKPEIVPHGTRLQLQLPAGTKVRYAIMF